MSCIIYFCTLKAVFLDEGPTVTALVMVVNGLRVTTKYVEKAVCVCVCAIYYGHPWLSNHVHLVSDNKWLSLSLWDLARVRGSTAAHL